MNVLSTFLSKGFRMLNMSSLRVKLTVFTIGVLLAALISMAVVSYLSASSGLRSQVQEQMKIDSELLAQKMDTYLLSKLAIVETIARMGASNIGDSAKQLQFVKLAQSQNPELTAIIYAHDLTGKGGISHKGEPVDLSSRPFINDLAAGKTIISDPRVSAVDGKLSVILGAPLLQNNKAAGSFTASLVLDEVTKTVSTFKYGKSGYATLFDSNGNVVWHPQQERIMKTTVKDFNIPEVTQAFEDVKKGHNTAFTYTFGGVPKVGYALKTSNNWVIFLSAPLNELEQSVTELGKKTLYTTIVIILLGMVLAYFLARQITNPIIRLKQAIEVVASGDMTYKLKVKGKDEIAMAGVSFNVMVENLKTLLFEVSHTSTQLAASSEQLTAGAEQTSKVTEHIANSIQNVAEGAERQVASVNEGARTIEEMSGQMQLISSNTQMVTTAANEAAARAEEGGEAVKSAMSQMGNISQMVNELAKIMDTLGQRSNEIGNIVGLISGIAQQTNLLSLNAAIEAARSGEAGRGFAVVATEIRKLADQTSQSAEQIANLIETVQSDTGAANAAMAAALKEVDSGLNAVQAADHLFGAIQSGISSVAELGQHVHSYGEQVVKGTESMAQSMHTISEVTAANAEETQNVSASAEQQLASMQEVASSSAALAKMAEELRLLVDGFKID